TGDPQQVVTDRETGVVQEGADHVDVVERPRNGVAAAAAEEMADGQAHQLRHDVVTQALHQPQGDDFQKVIDDVARGADHQHDTEDHREGSIDPLRLVVDDGVAKEVLDQPRHQQSSGGVNAQGGQGGNHVLPGTGDTAHQAPIDEQGPIG